MCKQRVTEAGSDNKAIVGSTVVVEIQDMGKPHNMYVAKAG